MSLIEEALRRVQEPLMKAQQAAAPAPQQTRAEEATPAHSWLRRRPTAVRPAPGLPRTSTSLLAVALAVLALTVVLIIGGAFWMGRAVGGPPAMPAVSVQPVPAPTLPAVASAPEQPEPVHEALPAPTPTRDAVSPAAEEPLMLTGVVLGLGEPYAVINGMIVGVGEQLGDATLLEIADGLVKLRRADGKEKILRVSR